MNTNFVIVRRVRALDGTDITKEWNALFSHQKLEDIKIKKAKQNIAAIVGHALAYATIVILSRRG